MLIKKQKLGSSKCAPPNQNLLHELGFQAYLPND